MFFRVSNNYVKSTDAASSAKGYNNKDSVLNAEKFHKEIDEEFRLIRENTELFLD